MLWFNAREVHMEFVMDIVAVGQVFLRVQRLNIVNHSTNVRYSFINSLIFRNSYHRSIWDRNAKELGSSRLCFVCIINSELTLLQSSIST
jgi:hypothetical protein